MSWAGFEPTIPVSERVKIFNAFDRAATVTGNDNNNNNNGNDNNNNNNKLNN
jgi:hypothetical protein